MEEGTQAMMMILDSKITELRKLLDSPVMHGKAVNLVKEILKDIDNGGKLPPNEEMLPVMIYHGLFGETSQLNGLLLVATHEGKQNETNKKTDA